jgi:carboxyl-terminal processing protease
MKEIKEKEALKRSGLNTGFAFVAIFSTIICGLLIYERQNVLSDQVKFSNSIREITSLIDNQSLYSLPSQEKQDLGKIKGLVNSLEDPYTEFLSKDEIEDFQDSLNQRYEGIGVRFDNDNGEIKIDRIFSGSPAEEEGLQIGDILTKVEDQDATDVASAIEKIRGPENTSVRLTFKRGQEEIEVSLTRRKIDTDLIYLNFVDDVAIIEITSFGNNLDEKMAQIVDQIKNKSNVKGVILDLRNNSGGLLNESIEVASYFQEPNSTAVIEKTKKEEIVVRTKNKDQNLQDYKLVILVNNNSASASEIVAGSLRDNRQAKLVGQKTFGKGVVQRLYNLDNGGQLKLTIAEWFTPNGTKINLKGLSPDISEPNSQEQLNKALQEINN